MDGVSAIRERAAGWALAIYLVAGSWSLARVLGGESTLLAQPRSWAVALLVVLAASPGAPIERRPGLLAAELAWLGFTLLALAWAPDLELAQIDAVDLGLLITVALCVHRLGRSAQLEVLLTSLRRALTIVLLALACVALLAGIGGGRLAVLGGGPNVFGRNMGLLCVLALERALSSKRVREQLVWPGIATMAAGLVALSGSRGAMIATAVAAALTLVLGRGRLVRRVTLTLSVGAIGLAVLLLTPIGARVIESFGARVLELLLTDGYVSGRDRIYAIALERGANRPVFGHGLASFAAHTPWPYAHNIVLDAWFETGAIGVALLGLLLGRFARGLRRLGTEGRQPWIAAAVLILVAAQFSGGRYDARGLLVFASLCLAVPPRAEGRA
jgi:O-antigen ligase